jgi:hypothetical protein
MLGVMVGLNDSNKLTKANILILYIMMCYIIINVI